jgi:hypothetical protein
MITKEIYIRFYLWVLFERQRPVRFVSGFLGKVRDVLCLQGWNVFFVWMG